MTCHYFVLLFDLKKLNLNCIINKSTLLLFTISVCILSKITVFGPWPPDRY